MYYNGYLLQLLLATVVKGKVRAGFLTIFKKVYDAKRGKSTFMKLIGELEQKYFISNKMLQAVNQ